MVVRANRELVAKLLFHRGPKCLVAIELGVSEFDLEFLGKLNFYLEALARDMREVPE